MKNKAEKRKIKKINKKNKMQKIIGISIILIAVISVIVIIGMSTETENNDNKKNTNQSEIINLDNRIILPISDVDTTAKFYTYNSNGVDISYFIVRGDDGEIHAAFDACDLCYHAKEGYSQDEDLMKCINCGLTFPIDGIGEKNTGGGCWPSYLPIKIDDSEIIIEKSDLDSKRYMFE